MSTGSRPAMSDRVAGVVTELSSPMIVTGLLFVAMGALTHPLPGGLWWGAAGAVFGAGGPAVVIYGGVALGQLGDRHLTDRAQRPIPLLLAIGSIGAGALVLALLGAPPTVTALLAAFLVGAIAATVLTLVSKVSFHTGVAAAATTTLTLAAGPLWLLTAPLVVVVGWSRLRLNHHTWPQNVAGIAVGVIAVGAVFGLLT